MNLISLVLFGQNERYWNCLSAALIANLELYPQFKIRLHISPDAAEAPAFPMLDALQQITGRFEVVRVNLPYSGTEPMAWRLLPLWDLSYDYVLLRDLDQVPCSEEIACVEEFLRHPTAAAHAIRSHPWHTIPFITGHCGFHVQRLKFFRKKFRDFLSFIKADGPRPPGSEDQWLLSHVWQENSWTDFILDHALRDAPRFDRTRKDGAPIPLTVPAGNLDLLGLCNQANETAWNGEKGFPCRPQTDLRPLAGKLMALDTWAGQMIRTAAAMSNCL